MLVKCWGSRGSIPVSGREFLKYGGDTTCLEVQSSSEYRIVIDAGSGIRRFGNAAMKEGIEQFSLLFTHRHWDHVLGFPFMKPLYRHGVKIHVYGCPFAQESVRSMISKPMTPPYFPITFDAIRAEMTFSGVCAGEFALGDVEVRSTLLSHPNQGLGYRFSEKGRTFVFLTDNELTYRHEGGQDYGAYVEFARGADLLVHDAEFTPSEYERTRTWGHSVYLDALRLAVDAGVGRLGLFHHNQDRPDDGVDAMVADCRRQLDALGRSMECFAMASDQVILI